MKLWRLGQSAFGSSKQGCIWSQPSELEGLVLGVVLGAALVTAQHAQGLTQLSVPLPQLLIIAVLRASGTLAAWRPSRRTARLNILRAATTE